ncbi:nucleotide-diphospho-sugar transferase [Guyanagaster necrorhizus]|uniref:Translation initiation factor eIF2B subunit epsilon n=1 Tax=Guyanagaster necrorhizus TaxID=856835 RepID=A0A9P7W7B3_9AGAR|nr:nucleotide-diphospho-sugar transferase [Guyanagaster necrorhizus MCA 3950]KAG7452606.1 nucleotide-diphospho-sugar transferase [Guyanagaster necrorhizus MCA 3950]
MAPKSSSHGKDKLIGAEDDVLQAVVLADSFNKRFKPLTTRKPRCLLPVCNAPLLDWTFESLALAGVREIFVMCRSHAEQVKAAIAESRWGKPGSGLKIIPIMTAKETYSPGDAMRDVYTRGLVTSDFVLVMGDLVSNIRIDEVVRVHKERRKSNKDAIMTMVVKESGVKHRTRSKGDTSVFVLDTETSECLHYEPVTGYPPTKKAHIPREIFVDHAEVEIRNDLIDCSIDICSVEVPSLFQDNFDYLDLRRDFVHGVLTSDLLMKNIYCYIAKEGYAARVKDTRSYDSVSKDILSRWAFPLVPDDNHPGGHLYEHTRGNKYIAKGSTVTLARTSTVGNNTLMGCRTQILEDVQIKSSVIGRDCIIGAGSIIADSYIFDGTSIGPECVVEQSIIGEGVIIKHNSRIVRGCLLGDEVIVGPGAVLQPFERLSKKRDPEEVDENEEEEDSDLEEIEASQSSISAQLGKDSNAIVWPRNASDDEVEDDVENHTNQRFMRLGDEPSDLEDDSSTSSDGEGGSSSDEDEDFKMSLEPSLALDMSAINLPSSDSIAESEFRAEVTQSLERAFSEGHSIDNAAVELKTLRMASNVPLSRVREAVIAAIVERIRIVDGGGAAQRTEISNVIQRWGGLIDRIGGVDAVETISILQTHCSTSERMPLFGQILAALYQADIVEEEDLGKWHSSPSAGGVGLPPGTQTDNIRKCWNIGALLIQQIGQQDSGEDSEEVDEDEDGEN